MPETLTCPHCRNAISTTETAELNPRTLIACKNCGEQYSVRDGRGETSEKFVPHRDRLSNWFCAGIIKSLSAVLVVFSPVVIFLQVASEAGMSAGPWLTLAGGGILAGVAMGLDILADIEGNTRRSAEHLERITTKRRQ